MRSFGMYLPLLLALGVFWLPTCMGYNEHLHVRMTDVAFQPSSAINGDNKVRRYVPTPTSFQLDTRFKETGFIGKADKSTGTGDGVFNAPFDVAVSPDGEEIDVSDSANHRIQRFTKGGVFLSAFGALGAEDWQFNTPKGLTFDSTGFLYIAGSGNNRIALSFPPDVIGTSGSSGSGLGNFQGLMNLGVNDRGIYSAETKILEF